MHAIEIADGQGARRPAFGVRKTPEDFHTFTLSNKGMGRDLIRPAAAAKLPQSIRL